MDHCLDTIKYINDHHLLTIEPLKYLGGGLCSLSALVTHVNKSAQRAQTSAKPAQSHIAVSTP